MKSSIRQLQPPEVFCKKNCSCEICKILKNTYSEEHLWTTASALEAFFNDFHQKCSTVIYVVMRNDKRFYACYC